MHNHIIDNIPVGRIAPSKIHGYGLFAINDIAQGTVLAKLDGQKIAWDLYQSGRALNSMAQHIMFDEWNALSPTLLLVRPYRTKYSFINHSRTQNCKAHAMDGVVIVQSLCHIASGDELTLDYRMEPLPDEYLAGHGATYL